MLGWRAEISTEKADVSKTLCLNFTKPTSSQQPPTHPQWSFTMSSATRAGLGRMINASTGRGRVSLGETPSTRQSAVSLVLLLGWAVGSLGIRLDCSCLISGAHWERIDEKVTGSASPFGLGRAMTRVFARQGAKVIVSDLTSREKEGLVAVKELDAIGGAVSFR